MDESWTLVGDFTSGIGRGASIRFLVERSMLDARQHRVRCDEGLGNPPYLVCTVTEPATAWEPTWDGDRMSPGIEAKARKLASG